ncbi:hypothetical protein ACN4EE_21525, partial [Geminocystis sp. CENA526]|uniref:hypothetical protein n=1 Tax=Geminocystis sp. CENA526 TaxID=1355871 RepID=UPI003D6DDE60
MIDSHYPIPQNPEESEAISVNIRQSNNFWRWLTYLTLLSLGGGVSYSWYFFTQQLIPSIEQSVSDYISRPVKLGKIEAISFNKIRLGESRIETTDTENDFVIAEGVEISLNPLQLLANQEINIGLNILNPQGFLQQNKDNSWIKLDLNNEQEFSFFGKYFHVDRITLNDGFINIKSNKNQDFAIKFNLNFGNILIDKNQVLFDVKANINNQEKILLNGLHFPQKNNWLLKINTENLTTNNINNFLKLPIDIASGDFTGDLILNFVQDNLDDLQANLDFKEVNLTLQNLPNSFKKTKGNVRIDNENVSVKNIETNFGLIPLKIDGNVDNNLNLNLQVVPKKPVEINQILSSLNINTGDVLTKGKIAGKLQITGDIYKPKIATKVVNVGETQIDNLTFEEITADLDIMSQELVINNLELLPTIGGKVTGNGKVNLGKKDDSFFLTLKGIDIEGEKVATLYQQSLPMKIGLVNGDYQLQGNWGDLSRSKLTGNAVLELETGKATINNFEINPDIWKGEVKVSGLRLSDLPNLDCQKFGCGNSFLNAEFLITGNGGEVTPENINLSGGGYFDLAGGRVVLTDSSLHHGSWQTKMTLDNLSLSQLPFLNLSSSSIETGMVTGELRAGGVLNKNDEMIIQGKGDLFLPQGDIDIDDFTLKNGSFMAQTHINNFSLVDFGDDFRGEATGEITWRGDINNLTLDNLNLEGNLTLSEGINIISQPLITEFAWRGEALEIKNVRFDRTVAFHDKVYGRGIISYDKETEALTQIDLEIIGKGIDLQTLPLPDSLDIINYQGNIDLQGRMTGDISKSQPNLTGKINLNNFQLANIGFSPLTGNFNASRKEGMNIKLDSLTTDDKLYIDIDKENQPQKITIQNNNSRIEAVRENQTLAVTANHLPLDKITKTWLTHLPNNIQKIGGDFSGEIQVNLTDNNFIVSNIIIEKPRVNNFQGDTLTTQLVSQGEVIRIEEGKIHHQENEYLFSGELISLGNNPQVRGKVEIKEGEGDIQNFLRSWEIFELKDFSTLNQPRQYGKAKDLYSSTPIDNLGEKVTSSGVSSSLSDNEREKLTTSVASSSLSDNEREKLTTSVASSS